MTTTVIHYNAGVIYAFIKEEKRINAIITIDHICINLLVPSAQKIGFHDLPKRNGPERTGTDRNGLSVYRNGPYISLIC